jgi:hypothetical protein
MCCGRSGCIFVLTRYQSGVDVLRSDIERALDELNSNEEGMRFVVLAKQKWPDLIVCERKWDLGLDALRVRLSLQAAKG